jgi:pentatricopeptide repeat protein
VRNGLLEKDIVLGNALIDMYVKCGVISKAQQVLEELFARDVISWSTLIMGYAEQGLCHEALNCLEQMQKEGLSPNVVTYICILKACGSIGAVDIGERIHDEIVRRGLLEVVDSVVISTALVDMYANCGMLAKARDVLRELRNPDISAWNALIAGYAQHGQGQSALNCLVRMQREGLDPNEITCLCVLTACGRAGLWEEARFLYGNMAGTFGITPMAEHHSSVVVGLGFAGQFDHAMSMIEVMPSSDYLTVWLALLCSCKKWGNVKLATLAFGQALLVDHRCASAYVLMTDIFAAAGMKADAEGVESMRRKYALPRKEKKIT